MDIWIYVPKLELLVSSSLPPLRLHLNLLHQNAQSVNITVQTSAQKVNLSPLTEQLSCFFCGVDKCGGSIEMHAADYLTSPGYPSAYPPSQQCVWVITAPEAGQKILINFNPHFDLEDRDCK